MTTHLSLQPDMTVARVAELWPATVPVLARHGIDRCCGGARTLAFVAQAHGLDLHTLLRELTEATPAE